MRQTRMVRFSRVFVTWQASVTKKKGGIFGCSPYEDVERSCGVTLFADDVLEKSFAGAGYSG